jgi:hypothetical protein
MTRVWLACGILLGACGAEAAPEPVETESAPIEPAPVERAPVENVAPAANVEDEHIGLGLTVGEVRRANDHLEARARADGQEGGLSLAACTRLEAVGLVARCTMLGASGPVVDRASFELPDPTVGRGLIQHYADANGFRAAREAFAMFEREFGTLVIENQDALLIFSGAEQLGEDRRDVVRRIIASL